MPDRNPHDLAEKIFLYKMDLLGPAERIVLEEQIAADPKLKEIFDELKDTVRTQNELDQMAQFDPKAAYTEALRSVHPVSHLYRMRYGLIAAAVALVLTFGILFHMQSRWGVESDILITQQDTTNGVQLVLATGETVRMDTISALRAAEAEFENSNGVLSVEALGGVLSSPGNNKIIVPYKKKYQIVLADGSKVYLNAGSTLTFPSAFTGKERRVQLEGEGFFEIASMADKQFVVEAGKQQIHVHGTVFNVKAYGDEPYHYTTLMEGKISLRDSESQKELFLKPGHQLEYEPSTGHTILRSVNPAIASSWTKGMLAFDDTPMDEILRQVGRWYNLEVALTDQALHGISATGKIPLYPDVNQVLRKFEKLGDARFQTTAQRINVMHIKNTQ
ncbi:DUF4974 domain-containing protein [Sphingobacterium olei]|uniref:DUF4974 domain-containing protein n=1 Tax=Sphingobacterium olei TaxID=2571155 RepID=A0A4U0P678_9SPHI|nr:FecR domain-containing protein [Sphingobacterium olei]TJZ62956.1 DUF4974 domain-containing protein [Sphingobacterium olei]